MKVLSADRWDACSGRAIDVNIEMKKPLAYLMVSVAMIGMLIQPCRSQVAEDRPKPLKDPQLVLAKEGTHSLWLTYTPPRFDVNTQRFIGYFKQGGHVFRAESPSGLNGTWTDVRVATGGAQSIVKRRGEFFSFDHSWHADDGWYHHNPLRSADGINFSKTGAAVIKSGEDFTLLYREKQDDFFCYIRPKPPHHQNKDTRKIGLMTSSDFSKWSEISVVLAPNDKDHPAKQFYSMSVVYDKKRETYWGFLNVFQVKQDDGPPYPTMTGEDNAVRVQLCTSKDGKQWNRCYGQKDLIEPPPGIYEQFAVASIREGKDVVDIYVVQSKNRHNVPGTDFQVVVRYTVSLDDLAKYSP